MSEVGEVGEVVAALSEIVAAANLVLTAEAGAEITSSHSQLKPENELGTKLQGKKKGKVIIKGEW
jgi:hypothetical protein